MLMFIMRLLLIFALSCAPTAFTWGQSPGDNSTCSELFTAEDHEEEDYLAWLWNKAVRIWNNNKAEPVNSTYAIELSNIKQLNELHLGITGTEKFLGALDDAIHFILDKNELGFLISSNYKTFTVTSTLDEKAFVKQVLLPLRAILAGWFNRGLVTYNSITDWKPWIDANLQLGRGSNSVEAVLDLHLRRLADIQGESISIADWHAEITALRRQLQLEKRLDEKLWRDHLAEVRRISKNPNATPATVLTEFSSIVGDFEYAKKMIRYYKLLTQADVLPSFQGISGVEPTEGIQAIDHDNLEDWPWRLRRMWVTQKARPFTRYVLASDGVGIGAMAIWVMDQWVADGADLNQLQHLLRKTGKILDMAHAALTDTIRNNVPDMRDRVLMYKSGDDAIFFLPELTKSQIAQISKDLEGLQTLGDHLTFTVGHIEMTLNFRFSEVIKVDGHLEQAIEQARYQVK